MNTSLIKILVIHSLALALLACGPKGGSEVIKDFRLFAHTDHPEFRSQLSELISDFNKDTCFDALKLVPVPTQANSNIYFVDDMQQSQRQIGYGEYLIRTEKSGALSMDKKETRIHSMNLYFDRSYFSRKLSLKDQETAQLNLKVLFSHEVGHGLEMKHTKSRSDVMYESTEGKKDFNPFFKRVQSYFNHPGC